MLANKGNRRASFRRRSRVGEIDNFGRRAGPRLRGLVELGLQLCHLCLAAVDLLLQVFDALLAGLDLPLDFRRVDLRIGDQLQVATEILKQLLLLLQRQLSVRKLDFGFLPILVLLAEQLFDLTGLLLRRLKLFDTHLGDETLDPFDRVAHAQLRDHQQDHQDSDDVGHRVEQRVEAAAG